MKSTKTTRKLSLNRETVRELSDHQLQVAGGVVSVANCWTPVILTLPLNDCIVFATANPCP